MHPACKYVFHSVMQPDPIAEAVKKAGSVSALAKLIGVKPQAISQWREIPARRVPDISRLTGIPRHELRPDLWEAPAEAA